MRVVIERFSIQHTTPCPVNLDILTESHVRHLVFVKNLAKFRGRQERCDAVIVFDDVDQGPVDEWFRKEQVAGLAERR